MRRYDLLIGSALVLACGESPSSDDSTELAGQVVDAATGAPLAGVSIRSQPSTARTETDVNGRFVLDEDVRFNQNYRVFAALTGYSEEFIDFTPRPGDDRRLDLELRLRLLSICSEGSVRCSPERDAVETCVDRGARFDVQDCSEGTACRPDNPSCVTTHSLSVSSEGGLVTSVPGGINCNPSCTSDFLEGTSVRLLAQPFGGGEFSGWMGPCDSPEPSVCDVVMTSDIEVQARFVQSAFGLEVMFQGDGTGRVTSEPAGLDCTNDCTVAFERDAMVTLTAVPDEGTEFEGWGGDCSGRGTCVVSLDRSRSVTVEFEVPKRNLSVTRSGMGAGSVESAPAGIDCGSDCEAEFPLGSEVALTAQPAAQSTFEGWTGACSGTGACVVTMDEDRSLDAAFDGLSFPLAVSVTGVGVVASDPAGIDCGADCAEAFGVGTEVVLTATTSPGNIFVGWSGDCSGAGTCALTMDAARTVEAEFAVDERSITVAVTGGGRVTSSPTGIDCPGTCSAAFPFSSVVDLTATPNAGEALRTWSGRCTGAGACQVTVDGALTVEADFVSFFLVELPADMACEGAFRFAAGARLQNSCGGAPATELGMSSSVSSRTLEMGEAYSPDAEGAAVDLGVTAPASVGTIELSARRTGAGRGGRGFGVLYSDRGSSGPGTALIAHDDGRLQSIRWTATSTLSISTSTGALALDRWFHVALSYSGTGMNLSLDGLPVGTSTLSAGMVSSSTTGLVGGAPVAGGAQDTFRGEIDEVRISDVARY